MHRAGTVHENRQQICGRRPRQRRAPGRLRRLSDVHRRFGRRARRAGALLQGVPDRYGRRHRRHPAPLARPQEHHEQPARAAYRDARDHGRGRDADRGQSRLSDPAGGDHACQPGPPAPDAEEPARPDPADRHLLRLAGRGLWSARGRRDPFRYRHRRHAWRRGGQFERRLRHGAGSGERQVRRHAAQCDRHRHLRRDPRARGHAGAAGRAHPQAAGGQAGQRGAHRSARQDELCRGAGGDPAVAQPRQRHRFQRLQAGHRLAPHRAPHAGAAHAGDAPVPRSSGKRAQRVAHPAPRHADFGDQLLPRPGHLRAAVREGRLADGRRGTHRNDPARLECRRCHRRGGVFAGDAVHRGLRAPPPLAQPEGVCDRRRPGLHRDRRHRPVSRIDRRRTVAGAAGALLRQEGQLLRRQERTAAVHRLRAPQPALRPALHQDGPGRLSQYIDLFQVRRAGTRTALAAVRSARGRGAAARPERVAGLAQRRLADHQRQAQAVPPHRREFAADARPARECDAPAAGTGRVGRRQRSPPRCRAQQHRRHRHRRLARALRAGGGGGQRRA